MGSLCNVFSSQLIKLTLALEESRKPFIWVMKGWNKLGELENDLRKMDLRKESEERTFDLRLVFVSANFITPGDWRIFNTLQLEFNT